jgi:DNA-binding CsgD family transcriptional regulator/PAS domain-containing protein
MLGDDPFDELVAGFYRAASGDIAWVDALWPFAHAVSAIAIHVHGIDLTQGRVSFSHVASELPAEAEFDYLRAYHSQDPRAGLVLTLSPGQWMNCWEHFDDDFVARDRFYQDFLIPYGGRYVSGVKLLQDESLSVVLGVHRGLGRPPLNVEELLLCKRLARHLSEALRMSLDGMKQRQQTLLGLTLLARMRAPAVLVDEQRRVLTANPAARELLAQQRSVYEIGGRMHCRHGEDDAALLVGLLRLLRDKSSAATAARADRLFLRLRARQGEPALGLYGCALRPHGTLHAFGERPLAMLLFHQPDARLELDPFIVAAAYDLTPAEARVAVAAARGAAPEDIAGRHGLSIHTVRSQLSTVFHKTGCSRQAELVSALAALPSAALWPDAGSG